MRAVYKISTVVLALTMTAATALGQDQMPWQPNLETAQRVAAQTNRLVLIHFWAPWCRPCMRLEQEVFSRAETGKQLEANYVMVKLNADEAPGTTRLYGVSSLPSDVITTPSGRLVSQLQSPPTASQYVQQMNQVAAGHRSLARKAEAPAAPQQAPPAAPGAAPRPTTGASYQPQDAAEPGYGAPAGAGATAPPADRYAEYFPEDAASGPAAPPATGAVTPAQAYAAVPNGAPPAQGPVDPYAGQAPLDPYAAPAAAAATAPPAQAPADPPAANPYAAGGAAPPADPYAAATVPPAAAPPAGAPPVDPYGAAPAATTAPPATNPYAAAPPAANPYAAAPPTTAPPASPYGAPPAAAATSPYAAQTPYNAQAAAPPQAGTPQIPPGCPPLALDGNCPVTLIERRRWAVGHPTYGAVHRGRTYLFLGPQEKDKFLADPDRYAPVMSGIDPVHAIDNHATVPGKREFGVFGADGRVYLFADAASRDRFEQNEQHYSSLATQPAGAPQQPPAYQAMRP